MGATDPTEQDPSDPTSEIYGVYFPVHISDPKERVQEYLNGYNQDKSKANTFDASLMRNLRVIEATAKPKCQVVFEFPVLPEFCSKSRNMHGGAVALLVDMATTMAAIPIARKDFWHFGGVSRIITVSYLRPIPQGITLLVKAKLVQIGKSNSVIQIKIYNKANKVLLCTGEHSKTWVDIRARM